LKFLEINHTARKIVASILKVLPLIGLQEIKLNFILLVSVLSANVCNRRKRPEDPKDSSLTSSCQRLCADSIANQLLRIKAILRSETKKSKKEWDMDNCLPIYYELNLTSEISYH